MKGHQMGWTEKALSKINTLGKEPFRRHAAGAGGNLLERLQRYNLVAKLDTGLWQVKAHVKDLAKEYTEIAKQAKSQRGSRGKYKPRNAEKVAAVNKAMPSGPSVRITPYHSGQVLIIIDKHIYLATEVALTSRKEG